MDSKKTTLIHISLCVVQSLKTIPNSPVLQKLVLKGGMKGASDGMKRKPRDILLSPLLEKVASAFSVAADFHEMKERCNKASMALQTLWLNPIPVALTSGNRREKK